MALAFTGDAAVDVVANNAVINAMACATSIHMMVTNDRVTDSLGGTCGNPSSLVHNSAPAVVAVEASTTATSTTEASTSVAESTAETSTTAAETTARML